MKEKTTALILSALVGTLGVDRFYLGYPGMGVLKLLTAGCFGILWILDIIHIADGTLLPADGSPYKEDCSAVQPRQNEVDTYETLQKIAELHDNGILSDEDFAKMKNEILSKI